MGRIGIKRKAGTGTNKRERRTPKAQYHGNGRAVGRDIEEIPVAPPPAIVPDNVGVLGAPMPSTPQDTNETANNQPSNSSPVSSILCDVRNVFLKLFEKESLPVEEFCARESGERLVITMEVNKEAYLQYLRLGENNDNMIPSSLDIPSINFDAFKGGGRNGECAKKAQNRAATKIIEAIEKAGSECQQVLALHKAVSHPRLGLVAKSAGFMADAPLLTFQRQNVIQILRDARNKNGRANNERRQFSESLLVAFSAIPNKTRKYSLRKQAKSLGLKKSQGVLLLQGASKKRKELVDTGEYVRLKKNSKRKSIYSDNFLKSLTDWVTNHPFVRVSPIANDTLLINGVRVPKLLREAPIREMHNDMIKDATDGGLPGAILQATGKPIMSDTELRRQLKTLLPELKKATLRHKKMCGCENCIGITYLHEALNRFRLRKRRRLEEDVSVLKEEVRSCMNLRAKGRLQTRYLSAVVDADDYAEYAFPDGQPLYPKPRNALDMIMCQPVESCDNMRKWKCVLGKCNDCPKAQFHPLEDSMNEDVDNAVRFQHYENYTKCSKHGVLELRSKKCDRCEAEAENPRIKVGKIRTRSELTLSEKSIGDFLKNTYLPLLEKYRYHLPHVQILSKHIIGTKRHDTFKSLLHALFTKRDFAEAIQAAMHNEVQGDHFGKIRKMILEGSCVEYFSEVLGKLTKEFHSHLSDDAAQCAATSFENMYVVLNHLKEKGLLHEHSTVIYDHTDGCTCQYRCATALYFLSMLSFMFKVTIDRMIHAPGHGKDEVDGLNATTKRFLQQKMSTTNLNNDRGEEKRMDPWAMEGGTCKCLSTEAKRLLEEPERKDGVVSAGKYKKRFENRAVTERTYHVLGGEEVRFKDLKMKTIQFKKEAGTKNGLMTRYNFRTDPNLGVGKVAIRRIPCPCTSCSNQLSKAWMPNVPAKEQERYGVNESCENWPIFEGLNNWETVDILPGGDMNDDEMEILFSTVLENIADVMARDIGEGGIGAIGTDDLCQFYLLEWTGMPYRQPEEVVKNGEHFKKNEHVCSARYLLKLPRTSKWYYRVPTGEEFTVRLQTVLAADIRLEKASDSNKLPTYWRGRRAANPGLVEDTRLLDQDHDNLLAEIERRQVFDYEESFSDTDDSGSNDSDNSDNSDSDDGADADDDSDNSDNSDRDDGADADVFSGNEDSVNK